MKKKEILLSAILTILFFGILAWCFDITYCLNDDVMIQSILSGAFSGKPSSMCVYLSQPLSAFLCMLYSINSNIPWLGGLFCFCYILSFFLILYRLFCWRTDKRERILLTLICVAAFLTLFLRQYIMIHYTVVAAITGGCGVFLLMTEIKNQKRKKLSFVIPSILFFLCYCIRTKVFFLLTPFLLCAFVYSYLRNHSKQNVRKLAGCAFLTLGSIAIALGIGKICYSSDSWQQYLKYNEARTQLYDYVGIWTNPESIAYYDEQGLTAQEQKLYQSYNIILDELAGTEEGTHKLEMIANNPHVPSKQFSIIEKWKNAMWIYLHRTIYKEPDFPFNYLAIIVYLSLVIGIVLQKKWRDFLPLFLCVGARSVLFCYLYANGRYPERVTLSIYLIEFLFLMAMLTDLWGNEESFRRKRMVVGGIWLLLFLVGTKYGITATLEEYREQNTVNTVDDVVYSYMESHSENFYYLDVYSMVNHTVKAMDITDVRPQNYLLLGGWMTGSPLVTDKMCYFNRAGRMDFIRTTESVYYIVKQEVGLSVPELQSILGMKNGSATLVDTIECNEYNYAVYRVEP